MKSERSDLLKAEVEMLVTLLATVKIAEDNLESTLNQISTASKLIAEGKKDGVFSEEKFQSLQHSIGKKSDAIIGAGKKLGEFLAKCDEVTRNVFDSVRNNRDFLIETSASKKQEMLLIEIQKKSSSVERQQPAARAVASESRRPSPPQARYSPVSTPRNVNALSDEELAYRQEVLAIQHFSGNEYYSLNYFPEMSQLYDKIWKEIGADGASKYRDTANIRGEVCDNLNAIIGNNVPAKFTSSKDTKHLHEKFIKAAMCIQQLGGAVKNEAYAELAEKELAKKKINPEANYKGSLPREHITPVKQSHSYPQYKK